MIKFLGMEKQFLEWILSTFLLNLGEQICKILYGTWEQIEMTNKEEKRRRQVLKFDFIDVSNASYRISRIILLTGRPGNIKEC